MAKKARLDKLLFEKGLTESREKAKALILEGSVLVNGIVIDKAGTMVRPDDVLKITDKMPYVSRGGLKLQYALKEFHIEVKGKTAMDAGASTGGFTDCLLQYGAARVYAVDVGYGQFHWKLRNDKRVVLLERTNIRYLEKSKLQEEVDIAVIDVSFISLLKVLPKIADFVKKSGEIIALIKPQFEAGKKDVGKGGIVKDDTKRMEIVEKIRRATEKMGLENKGIIESPVRGAKGNIEYLIYLSRTTHATPNSFS